MYTTEFNNVKDVAGMTRWVEAYEKLIAAGAPKPLLWDMTSPSRETFTAGTSDLLIAIPQIIDHNNPAHVALWKRAFSLCDDFLSEPIEFLRKHITAPQPGSLLEKAYIETHRNYIRQLKEASYDEAYFTARSATYTDSSFETNEFTKQVFNSFLEFLDEIEKQDLKKAVIKTVEWYDFVHYGAPRTGDLAEQKILGLIQKLCRLDPRNTGSILHYVYDINGDGSRTMQLAGFFRNITDVLEQEALRYIEKGQPVEAFYVMQRVDHMPRDKQIDIYFKIADMACESGNDILTIAACRCVSSRRASDQNTKRAKNLAKFAEDRIKSTYGDIYREDDYLSERFASTPASIEQKPTLDL